MSKSSDTPKSGFIPEVPSPWVRDPEVRAALTEEFDAWLEAIPPIAKGEDPVAWMDRVAGELDGTGEPSSQDAADVVDLARRHRKRTVTHALFEPWYRNVAEDAPSDSGDREYPLPKWPELPGSNLSIQFRREAGEIVVSVQAQYSADGPQPDDYANRRDFELVFGDADDDARCWRSQLIFDAQSKAEARLPDQDLVHRTLGRFRLRWLEEREEE